MNKYVIDKQGDSMKLLVTLSLLTFSTLSFAFTKAEINKQLAEMKAKGLFDEKAIEAAQKHLNGMSDSEIKSLSNKAKQKLNDPEIQKKLKELKQ